MSRTAELLLGNEAVAWAALDSGIGGAFAYAGTPATEIFETVQANAPEGVWAQWSANEKVALEEALGMSYVGRRALVSMKHVGLNVALDPWMSSALTGVGGGLVLAVGDDPGMHSSQNEQDSRYLADFAHIPCLEPSGQQECYDMTREAFRLSEKHNIPFLLRLTTRVAHSRSGVTRAEPEDRAEGLSYPDPNDWSLLPVNARRRWRRVLAEQPKLTLTSESSCFHHLRLAGKRGILCSGTGWNYVRELLGVAPAESILRIGMYPLPMDLIRQFVAHCDEILVIEEGYPYIERQLRGIFGVPGKSLRGKMDGLLPMDGELTPETVGVALGVPMPTVPPLDSIVAGRPPQFCKGCPHGNTFDAIVQATREYEHPLIFGDIGCYTLGIMPPYSAVHSCVDMGSSIGLAHGASQAGAHPVLCTIGDSTFAHSGVAPLLGAIHSDADITVLVLDNATTAMTGAQDSYASGEPLMEMLRGLGVKHLELFEPLPKHHNESVEIIKRAIEHRGLSVVVARRACVRIKVERTEMKPLAQV